MKKIIDVKKRFKKYCLLPFAKFDRFHQEKLDLESLRNRKYIYHFYHRQNKMLYLFHLPKKLNHAPLFGNFFSSHQIRAIHYQSRNVHLPSKIKQVEKEYDKKYGTFILTTFYV